MEAKQKKLRKRYQKPSEVGRDWKLFRRKVLNRCQKLTGVGRDWNLNRKNTGIGAKSRQEWDEIGI